MQLITPEINPNGLYPLPYKFSNSGDGFRMWAFADVHFVPTYHQWRLYIAIEKALDLDLFYQNDILRFVTMEVSDIVTPEMAARNSQTSPVEGGYFGYEVYLLKDVVTAHRTARINAAALNILESKYQLAARKKIKGPFVWGSKTYSSLLIKCINRSEGILSVIGTIRGSRNKYQFCIDAGCGRLMDAFSKPQAI